MSLAYLLPTTKQFATGTAVTGDSSANTSTTYAAFNNSATLTFTATGSGNYRVWIATCARSGTIATEAGLTLVATAGSPTTVINAECVWTQAVAGDDTLVYLEGIYTLTAGTAYTFQIQGKVNSGTGVTWKNSSLTSGSAISALQL